MFAPPKSSALTSFADDANDLRDRMVDGSLADVPDAALHAMVKQWAAAVDELDALGAGLLAPWNTRRTWDATGARSGRAWLADTARVAHASARLRVATNLARRCPKVLAALEAQQISYQAATTIAAGVTDELAEFFEPIEDDMVRWAATLSDRDLRDVIAHWRTMAENLSDVEPDERRYHQRNATLGETFNGMVSLGALLDPESGHAAMAAIDQVAEQLRRTDQAAYDALGGTDTEVGTTPNHPDRRRSAAQRRADALVILLEAGAQAHQACDDHPGGPNARVGIHVPWELFAAYLATRNEAGPDHTNNASGPEPHAEDPAERYDTDGPHDPEGDATMCCADDGAGSEPHQAGDSPAPTATPTTATPTTATPTTATPTTTVGSIFGLAATFERLQRPLDHSTLERLLCDCSLSRIVLDAPDIPLNMGRAVRTATPTQRRALAVRDGGCAFPYCGLDTHLCQAHHIAEWDAHHGPTDIDNLVLVCGHHHHHLHRKTTHRWTCHIDPTTHKPIFTPPPDTPWAHPPDTS